MRLYNIDHSGLRNVDKELEGKAAFVFADPPYGITQAGYDRKPFDYDAMWDTIRWALHPDGVVAVTCSIVAAIDIINTAPRDWFRYDLIWHKTTPTGFLNARKMPLRDHEYVLIFSPVKIGRHTYNPRMSHGHERKVSSAASKEKCRATELYGKAKCVGYDSTDRYPRSVMTFGTDKQRSAIHPNQKPVALVRYLIETYSNPGDLVLDPVAGSGTTGVAAMETGRDCVLCESDNVYFIAMRDRIFGEGGERAGVEHVNINGQEDRGLPIRESGK